MIGMDRATGKVIDGTAHLAQSIADLLTTPLGSRLGRRDYGSQLPDLIDAPAHATTRVQLIAATATALLRWEPRITLQRVALIALDAKRGRWQLDLTGAIAATGTALALRVPLDLSGRTA